MNNKKVFGKIIALFLLAAVVFGTTSCNRGYGCPYNTSVSSNISSLISFDLFK
ncbi:MAG: hypothetical protein J5I59_09215 [Saprospiraceae bacterium]|nr:hypothetical protein [Saprospiraceae bacterium]